MLVETKNLISQHNLAQRLGISTAAISNWRVRHDDFPVPVYEDVLVNKSKSRRSGSHTVMFLWPEVDRWLRSTRRRTTIARPKIR